MSVASESISDSLALAREAAQGLIGTDEQSALESIDRQIKSLSSRLLRRGDGPYDVGRPNIKIEEVRKINDCLNDITKPRIDDFLSRYRKVDKYVHSFYFKFSKLIGYAPGYIEQDLIEIRSIVSGKIALINKRFNAIDALAFGCDVLAVVKETDKCFFNEIYDEVGDGITFSNKKEKDDFLNKCKKNLEEWKSIKGQCESFKAMLNKNPEGLFEQEDYSPVFDNNLQIVLERIEYLEKAIEIIREMPVKETAVVSSSSKSNSGDTGFFLWIIAFFERLGNLFSASK